MAGTLMVNTEQVAQIATDIENLNTQLSETLSESKQTIEGLANVWEGKAAQATISAFNEFSAKYFQNYEDIINEYVKFLRVNVDAGYTQTETENVQLADQFK